MKISDIYKKNVYKVTQTDNIKRVLEVLNELSLNGVPVVDEGDNLVGMVVKADIYRFLIDPGHYDTCPVDWVMTKKVLTANEEDGIKEVAKKLRDNEIVAMPVIKEDKVIGSISIEDILDYYINEK
ncbi:CBS domain protein [Natranaerovirga hydrolytica]|uniref:CBS domain protein n=1 Tax=Natranaerovirga hydrolytica TaxID=680378 RepID=A0A4R1MD96_9FIRM|nr:CBS domain-containing protein [Natranaerovirga hydrolytica]TCK87999.1 CBS domain protein [Natranaerovirga hydrolytica]